jgi:hypothetical protein
MKLSNIKAGALGDLPIGHIGLLYPHSDKSPTMLVLMAGGLQPEDTYREVVRLRDDSESDLSCLPAGFSPDRYVGYTVLDVTSFVEFNANGSDLFAGREAQLTFSKEWAGSLLIANDGVYLAYRSYRRGEVYVVEVVNISTGLRVPNQDFDALRAVSIPSWSIDLKNDSEGSETLVRHPLR